jgi:LEA14-like dessication related protein
MKKLTTLLFAVLLSGCAMMQPLETPHVTLVDLRILDVTLFEQSYGLKIRVQNPNPVALPITGMSFRVDVNDAELGRGVSNEAVTVPAYGDAVVEIKLVSSLARIIDQIRSFNTGKAQSLRYRLAGDISVANRLGTLPFDYRGEIGQRY